jgi:undecaprenyl-diphosphatase
VSLVPRATVQVPCNSFSFTSSHAASHYALALSMSLSLFRRKKIMEIILFTWAATIGYAQIYVGVHYPFDIICGALLGIGIVFALNRIPFFNFKT